MNIVTQNRMFITTVKPELSLPKQISMQSLLYKTTTCLTRPATTFFVSQMKKNLSKTTTTKLHTAKKWKTNIRQQCIKNKRLYDYIYPGATLKCKVCLSNLDICLFFLYRQQRRFWNTVEDLWLGFFAKKVNN